MHAAATLKAVATALTGMLTLQAEFVGTCGETWQAFLTDPWRAVLAVPSLSASSTPTSM